MTLRVAIDKIKNIDHCDFELPLEPKVYGLVGNNGCGKSTIMLCLSLAISHRFLDLFSEDDINENSHILMSHDSSSVQYIKQHRSLNKKDNKFRVEIPGMYEGSLFYGDRFKNSLKVDALLSNGDFAGGEIVPADQYVKEMMSRIIHGDKAHYDNLYRVRTKSIAAKHGLKKRSIFFKN